MVEFLIEFLDICTRLFQFVFYIFRLPYAEWTVAGINGLAVYTSGIIPPYQIIEWAIPSGITSLIAGFATLTGTISTIFIPESAPFFIHFIFSGTAVALFVGVVRVITSWIGNLFD